MSDRKLQPGGGIPSFNVAEAIDSKKVAKAIQEELARLSFADKVEAAARAMAISQSELMQQMQKVAIDVTPSMQKVGEAMSKIGERVKADQERVIRSAHRQTAEEKREAGVPLHNWTTGELMSYLPLMARDCEPGKLDDFQLACYTQHILNNCSQRRADNGSYDGALQNRYVPELLQRIQHKPDETPLQKMRMAWSLFRTGAATLDEIMPLMDRADDEAAAAPREVWGKVGNNPNPPEHGHADGLTRAQYCGSVPSRGDANRMRPEKIPRALAQVGGELVADGRPYKLKQLGNMQHPNTALLQELKPDGSTYGGASFWVNVV